jgi:hypothetical protein
MKDVFRVYLGCSEKSIWPDSYSVYGDIESAVAAFQQLVERNDWLGKKVFAKLTFNSMVACFHRYDASALHANNFRGQGDQVKAQLELVMAHYSGLI